MSMDLKLNKAQFSIMIQYGGFLRNILGNLGKKKVITDPPITLARDNIPGLVNNLASNAIINLEEK